MFPIWALIWDSTKCDIKHGRDGYFRRDDIMVENVAGTFLQLFLSSKVTAYVEINSGEGGRLENRSHTIRYFFSFFSRRRIPPILD